jgi:hypothetical protein
MTHYTAAREVTLALIPQLSTTVHLNSDDSSLLTSTVM